MTSQSEIQIYSACLYHYFIGDLATFLNQIETRKYISEHKQSMINNGMRWFMYHILYTMHYEHRCDLAIEIPKAASKAMHTLFVKGCEGDTSERDMLMSWLVKLNDIRHVARMIKPMKAIPYSSMLRDGWSRIYQGFLTRTALDRFPVEIRTLILEF